MRLLHRRARMRAARMTVDFLALSGLVWLSALLVWAFMTAIAAA